MLSLFNFTFVYCCHFITLHVSIAVTLQLYMCPMLSLFNFTFVYCCHFITLHVSIAVTFHSFTRVHYSHFIALHVSTTVTLQLYICPLLSFCSFTSSFFLLLFFSSFFPLLLLLQSSRHSTNPKRNLSTFSSSTVSPLFNCCFVALKKGPTPKIPTCFALS